MKRLGKAILTGLLAAIAGMYFFITPFGRSIEEEYGLALLFKLRGPRPSPEAAVIVNIEDDSSAESGSSTDFSSWPRTVHAALVDRLVQYGAAVIAFDIFFGNEKNRDQDLFFADTVRRAGNVVLVEDLRHASLTPVAADTLIGNMEMELLIPPIEPLAGAALALAPFPLPKIPVRINQAWRFKDSCGDIPTFPAVVFQAATLKQYERLHALLRQRAVGSIDQLPASAEQAIASNGLVEVMRKMRGIFLRNKGLRDGLSAEIRASISGDPAGKNHDLLALIDMYGGESCVAIDFYGPPATHATVSYKDILYPDEDSAGLIADKIKGKVVFVGAVQSAWSMQQDGFYTVFTRPDGLDLSGVELAATVFANLVEDRSVQHLSVGKSIGLIFLMAGIACLISFLLSPPQAGSLLLGGIIIYLGGAHAVFSYDGTWVPIVVTLVLIPSGSFLAATFTNYLATHREHRNIQSALGFYLPGDVVAELSKDLSFITTGERKVYSVCVMTDARHYTTLSESMAPEDLSTHLKEYFQYLFREVKTKEGLVCNVIGDSMLALWPAAGPDANLSLKACQASLRIAEAVDRFNKKYPTRSLPTRIGLHAGYLLLDNIGAEDHYEYAPVGDIVNTASRIEGLNKHLGTQILASGETLRGVSGIGYREIGLFLLGGKTQPVGIYELFRAKQFSLNCNRLYQEAFPQAVNLFRAGEWDAALAAFNHCLTLHAEDGPSYFYKQLCESYLLHPSAADRRGIIQVEK